MGYILVSMAASKKTVKKNTRTKKTPKKKKPKVSLDNRKVLFIAALIIVLCLSFLSITFLFSVPESEKSAAPSSQATELAGKTESRKTAPKKTEQKKSEKPAESKKSTEQKKPSPPASKPAEAVPAKPAESSKPAKAAGTTPAKPAASDAPAKPVAPSKPADSQKPKVQQEKETPPAQKAKPAQGDQGASKPQVSPVPPAAKFNIPPAASGARICFLIDDGGLGTENLKKYTSLPFPIAVAVLPRQKFTKEAAQIIRTSGKELMLHQPMQAQNLKMNPGEGAIKPDMSLAEIYNLVVENLASLGPGVKGLNNHEGSLITTDEMKIGAVLDACTDYGVFFLDSRTTKDTMAPQAALERGISIKERDVFIDDIVSREEMLKQIMRGIGIANRKGKCIMIGHVEKSAKILPPLLLEMYPELKAQGYALVAPSQIR